MARITSNEASQFETDFANSTFSLADDQDHDLVQFLINGPDDILTYTVHEVPMQSRNGNTYKAKVSCLKTSAQDPHGTCPLCDSGAPVKVARFIPLYSHTHKQAMIWERGPQFIKQTLMSNLNRLISMNQTPINTVIDVVRSGKKGSTSTTYALYPMQNEPVDTSNLTVPDPEKTLLRTWSREDMQSYVTTGVIPQTSSDNSDVNNGVVRRDRTAEAAPDADTFNAAPTQFTPQPAADSIRVSDPTAMF